MHDNLESEIKTLKKAIITGFVAVLLAGWVITVAAGCNTISGIGTDVSDAATWTMDKIDYGFSGDNRE